MASERKRRGERKSQPRTKLSGRTVMASERKRRGERKSQ
jgi:hypothetical protein